jgi:hypothetical protein
VYDQRTFDDLCQAVLNRDEGATYAFRDYMEEFDLLPEVVRRFEAAGREKDAAWAACDGGDAAFEAAREAERKWNLAWRLYDIALSPPEPINPDTPDF